MSTPFSTPWTLPYGLPDFTTIRTEHYLPAAREGMAAERREVAAIVADPAAPTVENTLEALERSGELLDRVLTVLYTVAGSDATPEVEDIEETLAPELSEHHDAIFMDAGLYARVRALDEEVRAGRLALDAETAWLLENLLTDFRRSGIDLPSEQQDELRALNARITSLESAFGRRLLAGANSASLLVEDAADLEGLPDDAIAAARQAAADRGHASGHLLEMQLPTQQSVLATLRRRDVRERVHRASTTRGATGDDTDTREVVLELARLRAEHARLLGYAHHAAYIAEDGTARTTEAVSAMLTRLAPAAAANARREAEVLRTALAADVADPDAQLEPWDWAYYAERVRKDRYALDDSLLRPYLELDRVLTHGVFAAATALYGITFHERRDLPGYHPDVRLFEVHDHDGTGLGLFLLDPFTRESKRGGAWMNTLADQSDLLGAQPVVINTLNIVKAPVGEPTLLVFDEVITLFHEFGHALHALFSAVRYPSHSGTEVPRDFVEYPSQVNEMWAWDETILRQYAVHHETGEPMPEEWVRTMLDSRLFNEGFATTEYLAAAVLDQAWHQLAPQDVPTSVDEVETFEAAALAGAGLDVSAVPPRYRTTYFNHVFGGGYSAGYYSYIWSEVLDADTVDWFTEQGGLRRQNGDVFRHALLSRGGSGDPMVAFADLRGRAPAIEPLLRRRGLVPADERVAMTAMATPHLPQPGHPTAEDEVARICQTLLRIDTSNFGDGSGPGERAAAEYVMELLHEVGLEPELFESAPGRANVVVRIPGVDPTRPALVLHGHLDVVPAQAADWQVDPFAGEEIDGLLWGRGAVDMKDMDAMILAVVRQMVREGRRPARDVIVAFFADEEAGGEFGARFAVDTRPELFEGATEAVSEVGGFSVEVNGHRAYLLQTAEKGIGWLRLVADGRAGHGSQIAQDNAVTHLAAAVARIGQHEWPYVMTPTVDALMRGVSDLTGLPYDAEDPALVDRLIDALGPAARFVGATVRNTSNPTQLAAGYKANVIPGRAEASIDARFLAGHVESGMQTLRELAGPHVRIEPIHEDIPIEAPFSGHLVDTMVASVLAEDEGATVLPYALSAGTDNKSLARLGIVGYGFAPLRLPADMDFPGMFHGVDERVPVDSLRFGVRVLDRMLRTC